MDMEQLYQEFFTKTKKRQYKDALELIRENLKDHSPRELMLDVIAKTLNNLQAFQDQKYQTVSAFQVLAAAKIAEDAIKLIKPLLEKELKEKGISKQGVEKIILGNILQDHHALGKEIIKTVLVANGYEVIDLGVSVPASKFVETAIKEGGKWIYVSGMMYNTVLGMEKVKEELEKRGITDIKIVVGGAPFKFHVELYKKVRADYVATDALEALEIIAKNS